MMLSDRALMELIFETALRGCDGNVSARRNALWDAASCILADVLRSADPFTRERLLRGLVAELRDSIAKIDQLLKPRSNAAPRNPYLH
jgi:hypothetical protein